MSKEPKPPFRGEHIGSLLRPPELLAARQAHDIGDLSAGGLQEIEDRLIRESVALQEKIGFQSISDGEFRRFYYFDHFPKAVSGFTLMASEIDFQDSTGATMQYMTPVVTSALKRDRGIATDEFQFVRSLTERTPKVTLPSPSSQHYFRWREGVSDQAYPDVDDFYADVAHVYQQELAELARMGATYVQLDDVSLPLLCDEKLRAGVKARGWDPDALVDQYVDLTNHAVRTCPDTMAVGIHFCRGNNQGRWLGDGGYDFVAEKIFGGLALDFYCMEYDSPRAGSFEPLRFVPKDKTVVLGLISSKLAELEPVAELEQRIEDASRFVPLERLCLSPQCGFASTAPGNSLSVDDQRRKLELVIDVADRIWPE